jgi:hypothetical protein
MAFPEGAFVGLALELRNLFQLAHMSLVLCGACPALK